MSKSRPLPRWRITRIKASPAVELGTVEAPDADTAIRVAIKEFEVTNPEQQMRLAARRVGRGLGHASPIPLQLPRPDHRARNPPFQDWPHSGDCSNNNEQDEPEQPPIMSPSLALLSGLFLDNPVPRFHIFGGVHKAPPLQYLPRLRQPLFLKFPAALYSDYYGHDPSTVKRPISYTSPDTTSLGDFLPPPSDGSNLPTLRL